MKRNTIHFMLIVLAGICTAVGCTGNQSKNTTTESYVRQSPAFSADSALAYITAQCDFGPRVTGSEAHRLCGQWIVETFKAHGATVTEQKTDFKLYDGTTVSGMNIVATYNPQASRRLIICAHWDSRPWADHDADDTKHHTPIDAANDGASGVAVLLELARMMVQSTPAIGVDLICFDAEDCGTPQWAKSDGDTEHTWCLGSQYWAGQHHTEGYTADCAILLDMIAGENSVIRQEGFSSRYAPTLMSTLWQTAHRLGYGKYFPYDEGGYVTDDHLPINRAGIPCIDLIGSDKDDGGFCATWHTVEDNVRHIDRNLLAAVGQTVAEMLWTAGK